MAGNCDTCVYYVYDEEWDDYVCCVNMDEDEYARLLQGHRFECPYYRLDDEYAIVKKQM